MGDKTNCSVWLDAGVDPSVVAVAGVSTHHIRSCPFLYALNHGVKTKHLLPYSAIFLVGPGGKAFVLFKQLRKIRKVIKAGLVRCLAHG